MPMEVNFVIWELCFSVCITQWNTIMQFVICVFQYIWIILHKFPTAKLNTLLQFVICDLCFSICSIYPVRGGLFDTYNSRFAPNWYILPSCLSFRWCVVSLVVIQRNSATRRSYGELYIWVCCWQWGESLFWCFSINKASIQLKRTNVSISTHTWLVMWKS